MRKKAAFLSLGCKVNSYETAGLQEMFKNDGFEIVPFSETADVYIINTCTVTHTADHKSRQMLHRARNKNPDAVVAAVGCYVECQDEIKEELSVDVYTGNKNKAEILSLVKKELLKREKAIMKAGTREACNGKEDTDINGKFEGRINGKTGSGQHEKRERLIRGYREGRYDFEELPIKAAADKSRVFLKIQDGCDRFCSYCIIPFARGPVRSRHMEKIVEETKGLIKRGYKEFVLTGIHLSSYGTDMKEGKKTGLCEVLKTIDGIPGIERIRLGSLEPTFITKESVEIMAGLTHLCPHFHLSLQSGSGTVLKKMNRHYTPQIFMEGVDLLRESFDNPALTTDIIVGFPQESEEEFLEGLKFTEQVGFASVHVFKYSKREGTPAALYSGQVPEDVKNERSRLMIELGEKMGRKYREGLLGTIEQVLFEEKVTIDKEEYWCGYNGRYQKIFVPASSDNADMVNKILPVGLKCCFMEGIMGNIEEERTGC